MQSCRERSQRRDWCKLNKLHDQITILSGHQLSIMLGPIRSYPKVSRFLLLQIDTEFVEVLAFRYELTLI